MLTVLAKGSQLQAIAPTQDGRERLVKWYIYFRYRKVIKAATMKYTFVTSLVVTSLVAVSLKGFGAKLIYTGPMIELFLPLSHHVW